MSGIVKKVYPIHKNLFLNFNTEGITKVEIGDTNQYIPIMQFFINKDNIDFIFRSDDEYQIDTDCGMYKSYLDTYKEIYIVFCKSDSRTVAVSLVLKKENNNG